MFDTLIAWGERDFLQKLREKMDFSMPSLWGNFLAFLVWLYSECKLYVSYMDLIHYDFSPLN